MIHRLSGAVALFVVLGLAAAVVASTQSPDDDVKKDFEVLALKAQLVQATKQMSDLQAGLGACQAQLGPLQFEQNKTALQAEQRGIIEKYEKANPGYTLDPEKGTRVKKPDAEKPKG